MTDAHCVKPGQHPRQVNFCIFEMLDAESVVAGRFTSARALTDLNCLAEKSVIGSVPPHCWTQHRSLQLKGLVETIL